MTEKQIKPGRKVWRFEQMATNVNVRIDNPSESGMEHYVGLEHLDPDSLRIRRWGSPDDVEATKLMLKKGDIIFGRRRAYQRKLGVAEFDGICSAHAMVLRAKPEVVLPVQPVCVDMTNLGDPRCAFCCCFSPASRHGRQGCRTWNWTCNWTPARECWRPMPA